MFYKKFMVMFFFCYVHCDVIPFIWKRLYAFSYNMLCDLLYQTFLNLLYHKFFLFGCRFNGDF